MHTYIYRHMRTRPHADTRVQHRRAPTPQSSPRTQHLLQSRYPGYNLGRIDARTSTNSLTTTCPRRRHCSPALETCESACVAGVSCARCASVLEAVSCNFSSNHHRWRAVTTVLVLAEVVPGNCVVRAKRCGSAYSGPWLGRRYHDKSKGQLHAHPVPCPVAQELDSRRKVSAVCAGVQPSVGLLLQARRASHLSHCHH